MKPRRIIIVVVSCAGLILGSVFVWRFVQSELNDRQLAKDATALRIRAEQGDAEAQFKLGSSYFKGKGVPTDFAEAVRWYRKSAEQGYAKAEYNLGYVYREGKGVPQDFTAAERWCRMAAEQGDARAQEGIGYLYYRGEGVPQDYAEAVRWYRKSAEQGNSDAQYDLSYMYQEGKGVPQDHTEAMRWCRKAAEQGNARAQDGLGITYYRGDGVERDYLEAVWWYRKAAEQGYADAQYNLGYMYYYGLGVRQDRVEANRLFHEAAAQGNEQAKRIVSSNRTSLCPPSARFVFALKFLASLVFGFSFLKSMQNRRSRGQIVTAVATLLLISSLGLDLFWYFYANLLQPSMAVTALYFVRHLVGGLIIAVLAFIIHPKSAKVVLIAAAVEFIAILLLLILLELRHVPPTIGLLRFIGLPVGMSIPPFIFRWLDTRDKRLNGNGETAAPIAAK